MFGESGPDILNAFLKHHLDHYCTTESINLVQNSTHHHQSSAFVHPVQNCCPSQTSAPIKCFVLFNAGRKISNFSTHANFCWQLLHNECLVVTCFTRFNCGNRRYSLTEQRGRRHAVRVLMLDSSQMRRYSKNTNAVLGIFHFGHLSPTFLDFLRLLHVCFSVWVCTRVICCSLFSQFFKSCSIS